MLAVLTTISSGILVSTSPARFFRDSLRLHLAIQYMYNL